MQDQDVCYCHKSFRTAEDYRDHLPCEPRVTLTRSELATLLAAEFLRGQAAKSPGQDPQAGV